MTTTNAPHPSGGRAARYAVLGLLALLAVLCRTQEARAQWTTADASGNINNTNTGNVGIGPGMTSPTEALMVNGKISVNRASSPGPAELRIYNGGLIAEWSFRQASATSHNLYISKNVSGTYTDYFAVDTSGNVGVGTTAPSSLFHLSGTTRPTLTITDTTAAKTRLFRTIPGAQSDFSHNANYDGTGWALDDATEGGSSISLGTDFVGINQWSAGTGHRPTTTPLFINGSGYVGLGTVAPASKLHVAGNITVDGNINAKYQDVAEWVPSTQKLAAGTVVVVDAEGRNHVLASSAAYDTGVAGVVSTQPGISLGERGEGKVMVATTGRVKVKVDATRAPVRAGDLLVTSDVPGVAMKSVPVELGGVTFHRPGTIIGKALEPLEKGTGEILVLLSLQ